MPMFPYVTTDEWHKKVTAIELENCKNIKRMEPSRAVSELADVLTGPLSRAQARAVYQSFRHLQRTPVEVRSGRRTVAMHRALAAIKTAAKAFPQYEFDFWSSVDGRAGAVVVGLN